MNRPSSDDGLSRMIARLCRQRACLDFAAREIAGLPGPVLEVGLGKGRTFDRLRRLLPERDLYAFDRDIHCPPGLRPPSGRVLVGDLRQTLPRAAAMLGRSAALAHADIGSADPGRDESLASDIAPLLNDLVRPGGLVLTDLEMTGQGWRPIALPGEAGASPYFGYRVS